MTLRPIDPGTRIGHVHLKDADLERARGFYRDVLGFEVTRRMVLGMVAAGLLLALPLTGCAAVQMRMMVWSATPAEKLWLAASEDRPAEVRSLLARGVPDEAVARALGAAAAEGSLRTLEVLLDTGVDLDRPVGNSRRTVLHAAVPHVAAVERLLAAGASVEARDGQGLTPLLAAARYGTVESLDTLAAAGADPLAVTPQGTSALHFAAVRDDDRILARLLEKEGFELEVAAPIPGRHDRDVILTPLMVAVAMGRTAPVELLLGAGADPGGGNQEGRTPLMVAARFGLDNLVERLLAAGADAAVADENGETALLLAARAGHRPVVERLLAAGASPAVESPPGSGVRAVLPGSLWDATLLERLLDAARTAGVPLGDDAADLLYKAASYSPDAVRMLLAAGVPATAVSRTRRASADSPGRRPLSQAVRRRNLVAARLLVEAGAEVDYVMAGSYLTPLGWAVMFGDQPMADLLRGAGAAEPVLEEPSPVARLELALRTGDDRAALELVAAGAHRGESARALGTAVRVGNAAVVEALLEDLDRRSTGGAASGVDDGLVRLAVQGGPPYCTRGHERTLELLLARGLDADARDRRGRTALMVAADEACLDLLRRLLRAGAQPNLQDEEGWTPLMLAVNPFSEHEPGVMRRMADALLDHGAEVGLRNADGGTALAIAAVFGPPGVVRRLLSALERDQADVVRDARPTAIEARNSPAVALFDRWLGAR